MWDSKRDIDAYSSLLVSVGDGEGGMIWENGIETSKLSSVKWITNPGSMHDTGRLGKKKKPKKEKKVRKMWCHEGALLETLSSIQFSRSVVSDSLRPHDSQHSRPPCPSQTPGVYLNSCPSSRWCHLAISSSVIPFSSCLQSLPASGSFPMSQLFEWGGQSIGVSASASVFPMNTQDLSPLGWTGWISLQSKGLSRVFSNTTVQKHQYLSAQISSQSNSHIHTWPLEKT